MKVVILAGGMGTRISEESHLRPKPMIEIGGNPILWHIMKLFSHYGYDDFIICLGYRGYMIKEYFANFILHSSDLNIDLGTGVMNFHESRNENWRVTLVDTGIPTMTGGRLKRIQRYLPDNEPFFCTYGDSLADIDLRRLAGFHRDHGRAASLTAVVPPGRFGALDISGNEVQQFVEKPPGDKGTISGGFMVLHPSVLDRVVDDNTSFESEPLESLARDKQLMAFGHTGFWMAMDTMRDKVQLETLWSTGHAPWHIWSASA